MAGLELDELELDEDGVEGILAELELEDCEEVSQPASIKPMQAVISHLLDVAVIAIGLLAGFLYLSISINLNL